MNNNPHAVPTLGYFLEMPDPLNKTTAVPSTDLQPTRVLVVEDHRLVSEAVELALEAESDMKVVSCVTTFAKAMDCLHHQRVDVVLLDFHLPDTDGLTAAKTILERHPNTKIIVVSANEDRDVVTQALQIGCLGFVAKSESLMHLPAAIRSAVNNTTAISPGIALKLARGAHASKPTDMTDKELEILRLFAKGMSSADISSHLFMSTNTLRNYLNRINSKLDTHSKLDAVTKALRLGLITIERSDEDDHSN